MVSNKVGSPVTGDDFFGRQQELRQCWLHLEGDHILLLAPRRVGKTSLMLRLQDHAGSHGFEACYMSGADVEDEAAFVRRLYESVARLPGWTSIGRRLADGPAGKLLGRIQKLGAAGFSLELGPAAKAEWANLGERLAEAVCQHDGRCLLLIDEVPVFVLSLLHQDPTGERARRFLIWLRGLRQRPDGDGAVRWLLAGSIGLDTVAARLNLGDTINDLRIFPLGAFSPKAADELLVELSTRYELALPEEVRSYIVERVGWPIPYYLQLVFAELREGCDSREAATVERVDGVFEDLLKPARKGYFDYWRQRLEPELGKPDAGHALALLNVIAADETGASRASLSQCLLSRVQSAEERAEKLRYLLDVLEGDGYVVEDRRAKRFRFRSPLLREFWLRRVVP